MANTEVDESLYSRQLYVYGHEAQKKLQSSSVLIINTASHTCGAAIEAAKNVVLAGVNALSLMDNALVQIADLGSQFYNGLEDVGRVSRAEASLSKLASLNPYVRVSVEEGDITAELVSRYSVVLLLGASIPEQIHVNELCREKGIKFIAADTPGAFISVFVDNGMEHVVTDNNGQEAQQGLVGALGNDGVCMTINLQPHGLSDDMYVSFSDMTGMESIHDAPPFKVRVINAYSFRVIGDMAKYGEYVGTHGAFKQVKMSETITFAPLSEALKQPIIVSDVLGDAIYSHAYSIALSKFRVHHKRLPLPTSASDATAVVQTLEQELLNIDSGYTMTDAMKAQFWNLARVASCGLSPVSGVCGGIAGQEILKAISSKFTPITQFFYWQDTQSLPALTVDSDLTQFAAQNCRYDAYIAALGPAIVNKMHEQQIFLVGAGAIGCEMLKSFALMGVGTKGEIIITDMDTIEKSNLNRQFLFRSNDVGKLKSEAGAAAVKVMNPDIQITSHSLKVGEETESTYNEEFWGRIDAVYTALDNVDARLYLDGKCVMYKKPMVDSGTLGTAGNTQVIVPHLTESYGSTRDPPEQGIPICTLKNFPFKIEHTIQWARDVFEGDFRQAAEEVNNYLTKSDYVSQLEASPNTFIPTLQTIQRFLVTEKPRTFSDCVFWARRRFDEEFNHKILQLLVNFPSDSITKEGVPFWSGTKRQPEPIVFNANDPLHMGFIVTAANLHAFNYNLFGFTEMTEYHKVLDSYVPEPFVPKTVKIAATEEEAKEMANNAMNDLDIDEEAKAIVDTLPTRESVAGYALVPAEFEKDDDTNFHIAYITACSNLRARIYKIEEESAYKTKQIAGRIIPAIATTTALVTGFVCVEMFKLLQSKPLEAYRNTFASLAVNIVNPVEPSAPTTTKTVDGNGKAWNFTLWDNVEVKLGHEPTLEDILNHLRKTFAAHVGIVTFGKSMLFMDFGMGLKENMKQRLPMPITEVIKLVTKNDAPANSTLDFEATLSYENAEGEDVDIDIPSIRVYMK